MRCCLLVKVIRDSVPRDFTGSWSCRHPVPTVYQNPIFPEGKQMFSINDIVQFGHNQPLLSILGIMETLVTPGCHSWVNLVNRPMLRIKVLALLCSFFFFFVLVIPFYTSCNIEYIVSLAILEVLLSREPERTGLHFSLSYLCNSVKIIPNFVSAW